MTIPEFVPFYQQGQEYYNAARYLRECLRGSPKELLTSDPLDLLSTHAFELALKGTLVLELPDGKKPQKFGHDIAKLFRYLRQHTCVMDEIERNVHGLWCRELAKEEVRRQALPFAQPMRTDEEISAMVDGFCDLEAVVEFYAAQMTTKGNVLRYHQHRHVQSTQINLNERWESVPYQSLVWATALLLDHLCAALKAHVARGAIAPK